MENSIEEMEFDHQFPGSSLCMLDATLEFDNKNLGSVPESNAQIIVLLEVLSLGYVATDRIVYVTNTNGASIYSIRQFQKMPKKNFKASSKPIGT